MATPASCVDHHGGGLDLDGRADDSGTGAIDGDEGAGYPAVALAFAVADGRVIVNAAAMAKAPTGGRGDAKARC